MGANDLLMFPRADVATLGGQQQPGGAGYQADKHL